MPGPVRRIKRLVLDGNPVKSFFSPAPLQFHELNIASTTPITFFNLNLSKVHPNCFITVCPGQEAGEPATDEVFERFDFVFPSLPDSIAWKVRHLAGVVPLDEDDPRFVEWKKVPKHLSASTTYESW